MPVVGTLTVNLEANTAAFTGDLGAAASGLNDFGKTAGEAGQQVDFSMREARGSLMLIGDEFGIHLPREIRTMIAEIPGIGMALEAILPIMGVVFAAKLITEWVSKHREAQEEIARGWEAVGEAFDSSMASLKDKLIDVNMIADELAGDHLGALRLRLEMVDHQTMAALIGEFKKAETEADKLLGKMDSNWFMKMLGEVDTGPAQDALRKVDEALTKIRNSDNDPAKAIAVLSQGIVDATTKFDALATARRKAAGVVVDSPQDKFLSAHLTAEETAWNHVVDVLHQQMEEAQTRVAVGSGEKTNDGTKEAQAEEERQYKIWQAQEDGMVKQGRALIEGLKKNHEAREKAGKENEELAKEEASATAAVMEEGAKREKGLAEESLKQSLAMAKLKEAADEQNAKHQLTMHQANAIQVTNADIKAVQDAAKLEQAALDQEIANLNQHDAMYLVELQKFEDKKKQIITQSENEIIKLREKAQETQFHDMQTSLSKTTGAISKDITQSLMEGKSLADGLAKTGKQMLEQGTENIMKMVMLGDFKQAKDAAHAAASAFTWVMQDVPFPANVVLAPAAGAAAFAGVMAFEQGGMIPGTGPKPIIGHGGETVVTKALTDHVAAAEGKNVGRKPVNITMNVTTPNADSFKASQSQLHGQAFHAATTASKRNR